VRSVERWSASRCHEQTAAHHDDTTARRHDDRYPEEYNCG